MKILMLGFVALFLLGGGFWYASRSSTVAPREEGKPVTTPVPTTPPALPSDWKVYSNSTLGLTLAYDPALTVSEDTPNEVRFWKWGPTQKGQTEMYDGIIVSFRKVDFTGTLMDFLAAKMKEFSDVGTITKPLAVRDFNGHAAQTFSGSGLGDFDLIYVPLDADTVLEISTMAPDPTKAGFKKIVDDMLATVQLVQ